MSKEERYAIWNRYYQKHKTEINARRKIVRESYKNKLSEAENKIADLEKKNANLKGVIEGYKKIVKWCDKCDKIAEFQKEIRCECTRCVYSDSPCIRSDYGVENDEDVCPDYENVFVAYNQLKEENAELKADNDARKFAMAMSEKVEKQLREENAKLKDEWQEQVQKATDEGYARTLQTMQLNKAKELLKWWVELYKPKLEGYPITPIQEQTEQFFKDLEK